MRMMHQEHRGHHEGMGHGPHGRLRRVEGGRPETCRGGFGRGPNATARERAGGGSSKASLIKSDLEMRRCEVSGDEQCRSPTIVGHVACHCDKASTDSHDT